MNENSQLYEMHFMISLLGRKIPICHFLYEINIQIKRPQIIHLMGDEEWADRLEAKFGLERSGMNQ